MLSSAQQGKINSARNTHQISFWHYAAAEGLPGAPSPQWLAAQGLSAGFNFMPLIKAA